MARSVVVNPAMVSGAGVQSRLSPVTLKVGPSRHPHVPYSGAVEAAAGQGDGEGCHDGGDDAVEDPPGRRAGEDRAEQAGAVAQAGEPDGTAETGTGGELPAVPAVGGGHRAEQHHRVQVHVRVEPGQRQAGADGHGKTGACAGGVGQQRDGTQRPLRGQHAVAEQKRGPGPAHHRYQPRHPGQGRAGAQHAGGDQREVGEGAHRHHRGHVLQAESLPQHEGVLGADGDDQAQAQREAGGDGEQRGDGQHTVDGRKLPAPRPAHHSDASLALLFMDLDLAQLRALDATVRGGTLEAAARALHVTPSAISQRLRALEVATGRILLVRSKPVQLTGSGQAVLRLARQVDLLTADVARELGGDPSPARVPTLPIAVNADSMATWVLPALTPLAGDVCFDLHREDQGHTSALLRAGTVMAAVTADAEPVPGCTSTRLGGMRYRPMAPSGFARRWFPAGPTAEALARAPVVVFDRKDDLQHRSLHARAGSDVAPPVHYVPAAADYVVAVTLGLGWGMVPDQQARGATAELVDLDADGAVDVVLYWQQWRLRSPTLDRVREAVLVAAGRELDQPRDFRR